MHPPLKFFENSPIEGIKCKEDITPVSGDTTKVTIKNDIEQGIVVPRRTPVGIGELATDRFQNTAINRLGIYGSYTVGNWGCSILWQLYLPIGFAWLCERW